MAIDIGADAIDRGHNFASGFTLVGKDNPANATGSIDTAEIWAFSNIENSVVGTFYTTNGNTLKCRDSEAIGAVTAGSKQTFSGLSIDVTTDDYFGWYCTAGNIEEYWAGGAGLWYVESESIDPNDEASYTFAADAIISLYGTGTEGAPPPSAKRGWAQK